MSQKAVLNNEVESEYLLYLRDKIKKIKEEALRLGSFEDLKEECKSVRSYGDTNGAAVH